ncbi:MAG TPA: carboxypeptidase-like regulatory domain-containing protein, partial [Thermoanaerobaculia bacterium]|nr:carboxypeptidase-like regulatory domain-containing protein [Thermoanaerobaculia bacterium]
MTLTRPAVWAVVVSLLAAAASADEIARANLTINGLSLQIERGPIATGTDIPASVQTTYTGTPSPDLSVRGELSGPALDAPITLATTPGGKFQIPALHQAGDYTLANVRLVDRDGKFIQQAVPSAVTITVADVLKTDVRVRQLTPDELRQRGINVDGRSYDVYEMTFVFAIKDGETIEFPYPVIINKTTHEVIAAPLPNDQHLPAPPIAGPPPRFQPPYVTPGFITEDIDAAAPSLGTAAPGDSDVNRVRPVIPAAIVIPAGFGVLHQFFAVILNVSNNAPAGASIQLRDVNASLTAPLALRVAKVTPAVTVGQAVPIGDKSTGATFLVAQAQGAAEWSLEALQPGTHTLNIVVRATYSAPSQPDIPLKGTLQASVVVSDPRFQVNFVHPDNVRKNEPYVAYAFVTNASPSQQTVVIDTHEITACSTGLYANNICRIDGDPAPQITIAPGETKMLEYHLQSSITGHVFAGTGNAESAISTSVTLSMGVSASGVPLSPATLVLPYYSRFLSSDLIDAQLGLLGIAYSLASAPLTSRTALLPRVLTSDVMTRARDIARAGQRIFIARHNVAQDDPAEDRDAIFHLALDLLGNIEHSERLATTDDLRDFDALRRQDDNGRKSAAAMARELERVGFTTDAFASATSYRSPYVLAFAHGSQEPQLTVTAANSRAQMSLPAEAAAGWKRDLPYGEITQLNSRGESGEMAIVGRWSEPLEFSITSATPSFTFDVIYPDAADGAFLRASLPLTNVDPRMPVKIVIDRGKAPVVTGAQVAGSLAATPVAQPQLQFIGGAQDLHLDDSGHIVSILLNRPISNATADQFSLTTRVPAAAYESMVTNVPGAALQDDGRVINVSFDHALSSNATYSIGINGVLPAPVSVIPRIDNNAPGGIVIGKLLRGDGTAVPNTSVQMLTAEHYQYDTTLADGTFLFEFVPRDIDRNLPGNYTLSAQADSKFASLDGVIRTPGDIQRVVLQFLGRGSVTGTLKYSDGSVAVGTVTAGSTMYSEFHQIETDGNGAFTINDLPVGPITVAGTDSKGNVTYAATQIHVAGEVITQNLTIQKSDFAGFATVRVTVIRSDTSAPVAGAHVGVYTQGYGLTDGFTDANGKFEFTKVPAGFVSLLASQFDITRESAGIDFDLRADAVVDQTLTLHVPIVGDPQFVSVHGTVWRDDPAAPPDRTRDQLVPNALIAIRGLAQVAADANGEYTYPSVPLAFSGQKVVTVFDPASGRQGSFALPTLQAGVTNEFKILLQSTVPNGTATIRVHLVSATGASVSDYRVISPGFPEDVFTGKGNGVYELTVSVPRSVEIWAIPNGRNGIYGDQVAHGSARADFDGQLVVSDLRLPGQGTVLAKILVRKPCPVGQTTCAEEYDLAQGTLGVTYRVWDEAEQQLSQSTRTVSTDPTTSVATISQIPVGEQPSIATVDNPAGYAAASIGPAFDGDTREVELKVSQLGDATGRVVSFDGQTPIAGASVRLEGSAATLGPVFTGSDGSFHFAGVAANQSFRVIADVTADGIYRTGFVDAASPRTGGPVGGLVVVLRQQGSVDGTILDANGAPLPLAHYWARELAWPYRTFGSATDPLIAGNDGHFFLNNIFSGNVRVSAASPVHQEERGDWQGQIAFENDNQSGIRLQIGAAGSGSVSVTVVDPNNGFALVPFAEVTLLRAGLGFDFATTDANGVAVFDDVPADFDYSIRAASKRVGRSGSSDTFHLVRDAIVPVQVVLDLSGRVSGTLVDGDIDPAPAVKGAPVLLSSAAMSATASTGSAGDFLFDGVPEGSFKLDAIDLDSGRHAFSTGDLFISKLFPDRTGIQLSLEKTATLNVKTYLPDDSGQAGALAP